MTKSIVAVLGALSLSAAAAMAQTVGTYVLWPDKLTEFLPVVGVPPAVRTYINLTPAPADATIRTVAFRTSANSSCTGDTVKVKFFHRSGNTLTPFADSAPIAQTGRLTKATLATPVAIGAGDVIGLTFSGTCYGNGVIGEAMPVEGGVAVYSDPSAPFDLTTVTPRKNFPAVAIAIFGSTELNPEVRSQIIVAAAAAAGVGGSSFKTDIQLVNSPGPQFSFSGSTVRIPGTAQGRLVYHPEGTAGTPSDPSVPFTLPPGQSRTLQDFVGGLGRSGKGSVDVYTTVGFEPAVAAARVYEDSNGSTKGFTVDALTPEHAIQEDAVLFGPTDPSRFRMNIGVRTLDKPATISFYIIKADGTKRTQPVSQTYPANYYVQNEVSQITGAPLQAGDSVVVTPDTPAFLYSSIIDNASQDPSLQIASTVR